MEFYSTGLCLNGTDFLTDKDVLEPQRILDDRTGETFVISKTNENSQEKISNLLKEHYELAGSRQITYYQLVNENDCIFPRSLSQNEANSLQALPQNKANSLQTLPQNESTSLQIVTFITDHREGLCVYRKALGDELLPVTLPESDGIVLETQSITHEIYFSFLGKPSSLLVATSPIISTKRETTLDSFLEIGQEPNEAFLDNSFAELSCFTATAAEQLLQRLQAVDGSDVGPFDYRSYKVLPLSSCATLQEIIPSDEFRDLISRVTGLKLIGLLSAEIRHLVPGSYQLLNDRYSEPTGLDVVITLGDGKVGSWYYLVEGMEVAEIKPANNTMSLAYRVEGCTRFMEYISKESSDSFYQIHINYKVLEAEE